MKKDLKETLVKRGSVYGNYMDTIEARSEIMTILNKHHEKSNDNTMSVKEFIMIGDLVMKIVRASASPKYADTFHDIAGYAKLIEEEFCSE